MTKRIAVANRKGGVGKSTITMSIAYALAAWEHKRVLVADLDTQCNVSQALIGGQRWSELRKNEQLISDYFFSVLDSDVDRLKNRQQFVAQDVGEVKLEHGSIALLPGSLEFEDVQDEYALKQFSSATNPGEAAKQIKGPIKSSLKRLDRKFDVVLFDCPPGLSMASLAAIELADHVVVPFRPDFISQFGVDRISMLIEGKPNISNVDAIPFEKRRYTCIANGVVADQSDPRYNRDKFVVDTIAGDHPTFSADLPMNNDIRDSIDWLGHMQTMEEKFGSGLPHIRALYSELWQGKLDLDMAA